MATTFTTASNISAGDVVVLGSADAEIFTACIYDGAMNVSYRVDGGDKFHTALPLCRAYLVTKEAA